MGLSVTLQMVQVDPHIGVGAPLHSRSGICVNLSGF